MKKLILGFISLFLAGQVSFAQPVQDNAVIPMAITVNSILRLQVVSGGNIEFVFNTIGNITNGLGPGTAYDTRFNVASSTNWNLSIGTDAATFSDGTANFIALTAVGLQVADDGAATQIAGGNCGAGAGGYVVGNVLVNGPTDLLVSAGGGNIGDAATNAFVIHWQCGTTTFGSTSVAGTTPSRYSTNVFLSLLAI